VAREAVAHSRWGDRRAQCADWGSSRLTNLGN
jgi:hypothetical protein